MPLVFAQPQAMDAGISAAGGAAQVTMHDLPTLASMYAHAASANAAAGQANASRMQQDRQYEDSLAQQKSEFESNANLKASAISEHAAATTAELQQRQIDMGNRAVTQSWLNQQELSQQDVMRQQQLKNQAAAVEASGTLTRGEKDNLIMQIMAKVNPLDDRLKAKQAEAQEAHTKLVQEQGALAAHLRQSDEDFNAANMGNTFNFVPDEMKKAGVTEDVADAMGLPPGHPAVQARVAEVMREKGMGTRFYSSQGKLITHPEDVARLKQAEKGDKPVKGISEEAISKAIHQITSDTDKWAKDQATPPSATEVAAERKRRMDEWKKEMAEFHDQRANEGKPKAVAPAVKLASMQDLDQIIEATQTRFDLPFHMKEVAIRAATRMKDLVNKHDSPEVMKEKSPEAYKSYKQMEGILRGLPKHPEVAVAEQRQALAAQSAVQAQARQGDVTSGESPHEGNIQSFVRDIELRGQKIPTYAKDRLAQIERDSGPGLAAEVKRRLAGNAADRENQGSPDVLASGKSSHEGNIQKLQGTVENPVAVVPGFVKDRDAYLRAIRNEALRSIGKSSGQRIEAEIRRRLKEKGIELE